MSVSGVAQLQWRQRQALRNDSLSEEGSRAGGFLVRKPPGRGHPREDDSESCGSTGSEEYAAQREHHPPCPVDWALMPAKARELSFHTCLRICGDDRGPFTARTASSAPGSENQRREFGSQGAGSSGICNTPPLSLHPSTLSFLKSPPALTLSSAWILYSSRLGNSSKIFQLVALVLQLLVLHAVLPVFNTVLRRIDRRIKAAGKPGLAAVFSILPVLPGHHREDAAAYGRFHTKGNRIWLLKAASMVLLSGAQAFSEALKIPGICSVRYVPLQIQSIVQLAVAPWGQLSYSWVSRLNLTGLLWLALVRFVSGTLGMTETCDTSCSSEFEEGLELPLFGVPTLLQLTYWTVATTFVWGFTLGMMPTDVKGTAWSLMVIYGVIAGARLQKLLCHGIQLDRYDDGWAMLEVHCLSHAIAFSIIFAVRLHMCDIELASYLHRAGSKT